MNTDWSTTTKQLVGVGLFFFGLFVLYISRSFLTLIVLAALIAFLLVPIVNFFDYRCRLPHGVAILVTYLIAVVVVLLAPLIFVPQIIDGINFFARIDFQALLDDSQSLLVNSLIGLKELDTTTVRVNLNLDSIIDPTLAYLQDSNTDVTLTLPSPATVMNSFTSAVTITYGVATNVAGRVVTGVITFIVLLFSAVYFSLDSQNFYGHFLRIVPKEYRPEMAILLGRLNRTWRAYLRGQLLLMLIIGLVTWLGLTILGLPGAFTLGVIAGLLELVPYLGPVLAAVPAVIVALLQGSLYLGVSNWVFVLIIIGFYILVQQFENVFVVPRVLGGAVDLHPMVVMIGVLVGASVGGILGALLAAPIIASVTEIVRYLYFKVLGEDPFPPENEKIVKKAPPSILDQLRLITRKTRSRLSRLSPSPTPSPDAQDSSRQTPGDN
jgi:predicted PurR-regulated permease PerM